MSSLCDEYVLDRGRAINHYIYTYVKIIIDPVTC